MLNTKKWMALKRRGCAAGFVDCTDIVIGGNTDWVNLSIAQLCCEVKRAYQSYDEDISYSYIIYYIGFGYSHELMFLLFV